MNIRNNIITTAEQFIGTPYVWGGTTPDGFDCSGLTQYVYDKNGISIPRTAEDQYNSSNGVSVSTDNLQPGDLVFFGGYKASTGGVGHVGIYIGNGQFLHAPKSGDVVKISDLSSRGDYIGAKRYTDEDYSGDLPDTMGLFDTGWLDSFWTAIVRILAILFFVIIAVIFFTKAFDISII